MTLFKSKGCAGCHTAGSELAVRIKGRTLTEIAAAMWNHGPAMRAAGAPPAHFESGEMRELLSSLWAKQFFEDAGDAKRGSRVFSVKGCAGPHQSCLWSAAFGSGWPRVLLAPPWSRRSGGTVTAMLESMKKKGTPWPRFNGREMSDLIGYLNSGTGSK